MSEVNPCTHHIPCTIADIDQAIYGDVLDGTRQNGDVLCIEPGVIDTGTSLVMLSTGGVTTDVYYELRGAVGSGGWQDYGSSGDTVFYYRENGGYSLFSVYQSLNGHQKFTNIKIIYDEDSPRPINANDVIVDVHLLGNSYKPVIFHHNEINVTSTDPRWPKMFGIVIGKGLWYRNKLINHPLASAGYVATNQDGMFLGTNDTNGSYWNSVHSMGGADTTGENNYYIETNYVEGLTVSSDRQSSARAVWRFNQMVGSSSADHGFDSSTRGERHSEFYNNDFTCPEGYITALSCWASQRGGSGMYFNNNFEVLDADACGYSNGGYPALRFSIYKLKQAEPIPNWPGIYPDTYPFAHGPGWGWLETNTHPGVGSDATQGQPGTSVPESDGWDQSLEPIMIFNNTYATPSLIDVETGYPGEGRMYTVVNNTKNNIDTIEVGDIYVNATQHAFVALADLAGGTQPTISSNLGVTWNAVNGGSNGSLRLSAWEGRVPTTGRLHVTITFPDGATTAARAVALSGIRNLTTSPKDKNPSVTTQAADVSNSYSGPDSTGPLAQAEELTVGYFAFNGPTTWSAQFDMHDDDIHASSPYVRAVAYGQQGSTIGIHGTLGGADTDNVSVAVIYRAVNVNTAVSPGIINNGQRAAVCGTVTFKVNGNAATIPSVLDLQIVDFFQPNVEYYTDDGVTFDGSEGIGVMTRSAMDAITTCTEGVGVWVTDEGSWNTENATVGAPGYGKGQGRLYKCNGSNTWVLYYEPKIYPHPLVETTPTGAGPTAPSSQRGASMLLVG